jgi:hypothetical protein
MQYLRKIANKFCPDSGSFIPDGWAEEDVEMHHFAWSHSLTLVGCASASVRIVLMIRKEQGRAVCCSWLRLEQAAFAEAIAIGAASLGDRSGIAVAIAGRDVSDSQIQCQIEQACSAIGLDQFQLATHRQGLTLLDAT